MCIKNMNIATDFYESDLSAYSGSTQFGRVIEKVKAPLRDDGKHYINELTIATTICALSSHEDPDLTKKYDIRWTFGTVKSDAQGEDYFDYYIVSDSEFNPIKNKKEKKSRAICHHFSNQTFKFTLRDYEVAEPGEYYLKVFLRSTDGSAWTLQSMNYINVEF